MAGEHYQRVEVTSRKSLREWLSKHHTQKESVWIVTFKKPDERYLPYEECVQEALCFGWIDSLPRKLDELRTMRLLSPRKPKSAWSKVNKDYVETLIADGLMTEAGLKVIAAAKASGHWTRLDEVESLAVPVDLDLALAKSKTAGENFHAFPASVRKAILDWINQARKVETRAARITETVEKAKLNIRANQWRQASGR
jgi:uncharacterized protein YdeI (YjbR/CyaY-like superfamily)